MAKRTSTKGNKVYSSITSFLTKSTNAAVPSMNDALRKFGHSWFKSDVQKSATEAVHTGIAFSKS
jgi:hypothetical protein